MRREMQYSPIQEDVLYGERRSVEDRRKRHFQAFLYSIYKARRKTVRRSKSEALASDIDFYKRWGGMIALSITCLSAADAFFTLKILDKGGTEVNPFMAALLDVNDTVFVVVKLFLTVICLLFSLVHINFNFLGIFPMRHILAILLGIYGCLMVYQVFLLSL
jgi:uncharacterized protein DUF5658